MGTGFITRLLLLDTIVFFVFVSSISAQDSGIDNNEKKQESEGSGKELGRRGMVSLLLLLDLLFFPIRIGIGIGISLCFDSKFVFFL